MLNSSRKPGSHHLLVGQQGQDREEDDAAPGEDPKRCVQQAGAHRSTFTDWWLIWQARAVTEIADYRLSWLHS